MVIDFNPSQGANRAGQSGAANGKRDLADTTRAPEQPAADKAPAGERGVKLSSQAQQLQAIEESLRELPEVDSERVARLRQAISDGSYQADSARIADKLLALEE